MKIYFAIPALAIIMLSSSCVSKKKFVALQDVYYQTTDSLVDVTDHLNDRLASGEKDFEFTKQDLMISDAAKNDKISDLDTELKELQSSFDRLTHSLENTEERYEATQQANDQASFQLVRMNKDLVQLRQDTVSLNYALKLERRKAESQQHLLEQKTQEFAQNLNSQKEEILGMKKAAETNRLKSKEMQRQLALFEKEMDDISTSFIALRKEMLKAKLQGVAIDPNQNDNVSKIAKALGQY